MCEVIELFPLANGINIDLNPVETCSTCGKESDEQSEPFLVLASTDGKVLHMYCGFGCLQKSVENTLRMCNCDLPEVPARV